MGVKVIKSTAEITLEELEKLKEEESSKYFFTTIDIVNDNKDFNNVYGYDIDLMISIKKKINEIVEDVKGKFSEPDIEKKIFTYVYTKLAYLIEYDEFASKCCGLSGYDRDRTEEYVERANDLEGGLLYGKSMCGGYAEILRNVLAELDIESLYIVGEREKGSHAWNQVKLDGKWYNVDLTQDRDHIVDGSECSYFLRSNEDFNRYKKYTIRSKRLEICEENVENPEQLLEECGAKPFDSKDIAKLDEESRLADSDIGGVKGLFARLVKVIGKGLGEK